ncbi:magnesium transporter MRS2-3 isoform X2 [Nymphaea colorata]|uniref:magnesium transporter MRS2-3 isoform X2 n=1 Tax=Nymphaea colorata TaxID=210225 RepID=UPI00129D6599|nr:magnesium transporter MRS2-3 isoform X2 [Nymphaea colorata]
MRSRVPAAKPGVSPLEEEPAAAAATMDGWAARPRKKGTGLLRTWMKVDSSGQAQVIEAGKHAIMRRTGLPARDLRILDPLLSYPSTVLGRERAIVINLEHIKAIITAQEVLLLNSKDPAVSPFVEELQRRILRSHHALKQQQMQRTQLHQQEDRNGSGDAAEWQSGYDSTVSPNNAYVNLNTGYGGEDGKGEGRLPVFENSDGSRLLPFEFIALEACLEAACSCLETEARTLEQEAHPALDKLTSKISTLNLERVRQIKSRLVAITGRVQKVRDELEHLLDDDDDMAEMYLTDKLMQQRLDESSSFASLQERGDSMDEQALPSDMDDRRMPVEASLETNELSDSYQPDIHNLDKEDSLLNESSMLRVDSHGTHAVSTDSSNKHLDVEELEMLLEAYFVQIDGTLNKLSTLREYVDDTEDYINIMLDDKQNHLLQMGVMLTTATLVVSAFVVVAGIFGMNINIDLFEKEKAGMPQFLLTVGGGTTGSIIIYIIAIAWCKHKRLLE